MRCGRSLGLTVLWMGWDGALVLRDFGMFPATGSQDRLQLCMRKPGILVMALAASSAAPPILALLSIPVEFKMVSS